MGRVERVRTLRPTRRGYAVVAIAVVAFTMGATAGARSLNAVVVPALVGLVASAFQVVRADTPSVERSTPEPGFDGDRRRVTVTVDAEVPCTVSERLNDGIAVRGGDPSVTVGHGGTFEYEIELQRRGNHDLGPARCRLTDSLGLFVREVETETTTTALVYPDVYDIEGERLADLVRRVLGHDRSSFDRLREFSPGDSMRDIHWKASAKRPTEEFVVAEYQSKSEATHVEVVGESALGSADAMASTVASVVTHLQEAGVTVTVTVPSGRTVAHPGDAASLLRLLALTGDGWVDDKARASADVVVRGEGGAATVTVSEREVDFEDLLGGHRGEEVLT